jgi:hypothetical protein
MGNGVQKLIQQEKLHEFQARFECAEVVERAQCSGWSEVDGGDEREAEGAFDWAAAEDEQAGVEAGDLGRLWGSGVWVRAAAVCVHNGEHGVDVL